MKESEDEGGFVEDGKGHVEECGALITGFVLVLD